MIDKGLIFYLKSINIKNIINFNEENENLIEQLKNIDISGVNINWNIKEKAYKPNYNYDCILCLNCANNFNENFENYIKTFQSFKFVILILPKNKKLIDKFLVNGLMFAPDLTKKIRIWSENNKIKKNGLVFFKMSECFTEGGNFLGLGIDG